MKTLGHPPPRQFAQHLEDRGMGEDIVQAALDYQCDACLETTRGTKTARPATLTKPKDPNDLIGIDGFWLKIKHIF